MDILYLIGRIVVGGFFLMNAMNHLTKAEMMAGYAASKGVPAPKLAVVGTGVQLLVGGLMILLGWYLWVGALILVLFLVPVALVMHNFWTVQDAQTRMVETTQFMKNLAIAGALLMVMAASYATGWHPIALGQ
jgi:putative oxidoreductase